MNGFLNDIFPCIYRYIYINYLKKRFFDTYRGTIISYLRK